MTQKTFILLHKSYIVGLIKVADICNQINYNGGHCAKNRKNR